MVRCWIAGRGCGWWGGRGVGLDNVDVAACRARGVEVVYTPDANTQAVVEYVLGLMLDAHRPRTAMGEGAEAAAFHALRKSEVGVQLSTLTLGIVGFGRIGRRLGRVAHTLGMKLLVCDLLPESRVRAAVEEGLVEEGLGVGGYPFEYVSHDTLYAGSDVVTLHVDGRAENRGLVGAAAMSLLRRDALLINTSRGMVVEAGALADWLRANEGARRCWTFTTPSPRRGIIRCGA